MKVVYGVWTGKEDRSIDGRKIFSGMLNGPGVGVGIGDEDRD